MNRRVSKSLTGLVFALILSLSAPTAFAATRDGRFGPDFGTRIVKMLKHFLSHFTSQDDIDTPHPPIP
jgi:hypothetical protein